MPAHLALGCHSGALLASSPWLLGFARQGTRYWLPHAGSGCEILATPPPRQDLVSSRSGTGSSMRLFSRAELQGPALEFPRITYTGSLVSGVSLRTSTSGLLGSKKTLSRKWSKVCIDARHV